MGKVELIKVKEIYAVTSHVVLLHDSHMYTSLQIVEITFMAWNSSPPVFSFIWRALMRLGQPASYKITWNNTYFLLDLISKQLPANLARDHFEFAGQAFARAF